jgi:hypothetical protein
MIVVQFAEEVRKELRERMNDIADTLAGGGAESFEKYQALCGEIRGLAIAERALLDAAERLEKVNG